MTRPKVVVYNTISVDGRLTIAPEVNLMAGDARWDAITASLPDPFEWLLRLHDPQVLMEGSGSFPDNLRHPHGSATGSSEPRPEDFMPPEVVDRPGRRWFVVVDGQGQVDLKFTEWPHPAMRGWHALVLTSGGASTEHLEMLRRRGIPYMIAGQSEVDLALALDMLATRLRTTCVVCTGGGLFGGALLRAGLVDEICLDVLPAAIGGISTPALFDGQPLAPEEWPTGLNLVSAEPLDRGVMRLRYETLGTSGAGGTLG